MRSQLPVIPSHSGVDIFEANPPAGCLVGILGVRCKVPKGGPSGETGIPWQPIGVEPGIAKTA